MLFINTKELTNNPGSKIKLVLKSKGEWVEKNYRDKITGQPKTFNVCNFIVEQDNQEYELGASPKLKRKLDILDLNDAFLLSYEPFTKNGELMHYWKVDPIERTENAFTNYVADKKADDNVKPEMKEKVLEKSSVAANGARFGMIFNNTMNLYKHFDYSWNTEEFVKNFKRIELLVSACENAPDVSPAESVAVDHLKPKVEEKPVEIPEDELPF